jgi:hypothetical protein
MLSASSTEAALTSFAAVSLKPLLRFITAECVSSMRPNDSSIVDFVINLLIANKERLEKEFRIGTDRAPLHPIIAKDALATESPAPISFAGCVDTRAASPHHAASSIQNSAIKDDALFCLARDRVAKGFQRRDHRYLHNV